MMQVNAKKNGPGQGGGASTAEAIVPTDTIILLAFVISAFAVFAGAVLWADRQTRNLPRR